MSNAASLFLPGSNLTNLIVLHGEHVSGATFLPRMLAAAVAPVARPRSPCCSSCFVARSPACRRRRARVRRCGSESGRWQCGRDGAIVLLAVAGGPRARRRGRGGRAARPPAHACIAAVDLRGARAALRRRDRARRPRPLVDRPRVASRLARRAGRHGGSRRCAAVGRQQPAGRRPPDPASAAARRALLLGLNIGPNLAVTGSLSALPLAARRPRRSTRTPSARRTRGSASCSPR